MLDAHMDQLSVARYNKVLEVLPDVAECAHSELILVGGAALALFHLKHRISVDLDFVPASGDEVKRKEALKGCLTKGGYRTTVGAFKNQFVVLFEDTGIKVGVFRPERKIASIESRTFGGVKIEVASLDDIFDMKLSAYSDRREARDLFDIFSILKRRGEGFGALKKLIAEKGAPKNMDEVRSLAVNRTDVDELEKVISGVAP